MSSELKSQPNYFYDQDHAYREWAKKNKFGYIANCTPKSQNGAWPRQYINYPKIHRANCRFLVPYLPEDSPSPTGKYGKICSVDLSDLKAYLQAQFDYYSECQICMKT